MPNLEPPDWLSDRSGRNAAFRERMKREGKYQPEPENRVQAHQESYRKRLTEYVEAWLNAEENFGTFCNKYPHLNEQLQAVLRDLVFGLDYGGDGEAFFSSVLPIEPTGNLDYGIGLASWGFADFTLNRLRHRLGKCTKCGKYYLARTQHKNKLYCSGLCRKRGSAQTAGKKKRTEQNQRKLKRVRKQLLRFSRSRVLSPDWKRRVAKSSGVTLTWLTRHSRELRIPKSLLKPSR